MSESVSEPKPKDCPCEAVTHHYKGAGFGHGPVRDPETIAMAVFNNLDRNVSANRLTAESFDVRQLKRTNLSLLRCDFTSKATINSDVVLPNQRRQGDFVGLACANVGSVRSVEHGDVRHRVVCLIDKVELGDHDGHAALGFSDAFSASLETMSEKRRNIQRGLALATLAEKFGDISQLPT